MKKFKINRGIVLRFSVLLFVLFGLRQANQLLAQQLTPEQTLGRSILKELIEINTTASSGNTTIAANAMAKRFLGAGYAAKDVQVIGPKERNKNVIVRIHGTGKAKPILFLAHLDVVEALRKDWSMDPFKLTEKDGFFYGRGTSDIKDGAAILAANFIRLKNEGYKPDRDLILALTAGEEGGMDYNGVEWLLNNHRELIDAEFCINMDAGDPQIKDGKRISRTVQLSEKAFLSFNLEVKNPGGHSSLPPKENAIYRLANGLVKFSKYNFPPQLNEITRSYFDKMSTLETGQVALDMKAVSQNPLDTAAISRLSASPYYNALIRTTCVATMLKGGHAENALPQSATAIINCRVMPGSKVNEIQNAIENAIDDKQVIVTTIREFKESPASSLNPAIMKRIEEVTEQLWPGLMVVPVMEVGATDGFYSRAAGIPTYAVSGVFIDVDDVRAHGKDERIGVKDFYDGMEYEYVLIKTFGSSE
ncbi:MAG: M20/M25/M40 family metallo-hydrolase [Chitinophagaceae bacterium]